MAKFPIHIAVVCLNKARKMAMMLLFREKDFIFGFSILFRMED
jgi:hypothetical protein